MGWPKKTLGKLTLIISVLIVLIAGIIFIPILINSRNPKPVAIYIDKSLPLHGPGKRTKLEDGIRIDKLNYLEDVKNPNTFRAFSGKVKRRIDKVVHRNDKSIPVLMYHYIDYSPTNEMCVPKEKFAEQMRFLKDDGFKTLSLDEVYSYFSNNTVIPDKPVVITFDDGYVDNYNNAYPVLKELGFKATIFDITSTIDTNKKFLTSDEIKELDNNGIRVEPHTVTHPRLNTLSFEEQYKEIKDSKTTLENLLGRKAEYFAYPYGDYNTDTLEILEDLDIKMAVTTFNGRAQKSDGFYNLSRLPISKNYDMDYFKELLDGPKKK